MIKDSILEDIYYSLLGQMQPEHQTPGVEDAFSPGSICDSAWQKLDTARARLLNRLGAPEEDSDLEEILDHCDLIQKELCLRMFRLGFTMGAVSAEMKQKP